MPNRCKFCRSPGSRYCFCIGTLVYPKHEKKRRERKVIIRVLFPSFKPKGLVDDKKCSDTLGSNFIMMSPSALCGLWQRGYSARQKTSGKTFGTGVVPARGSPMLKLVSSKE